MIVQENFDVNGRAFVRTYSDSGRYVVRDGVEYEEACDPAEFGRTYTEGEIMPSNPIHYEGNMALVSGKYYEQDGFVYRCFQDTINPVCEALRDLVGIYVEEVA